MTPAPKKREIPFLFGIRGISSLYVVVFHLNYMLLDRQHIFNDPPQLYHALTDWMRYGDFRIAAFFVISGYLLTIPATRNREWTLTNGARGFLKHRARRLLGPYYVALALSIPLYLAWAAIAHHVPSHGWGPMLTGGIVSHVLLVHNLFPQTMLLLNEPLWNVGLEYQCYALFALVLLPMVRRFGLWRHFLIVLALSLLPHFLFHGFLDWVRPWFVALYAFGVVTIGISNRNFPELQRFERNIPWGTIFVVCFILTPIAIWQSGMDAPYGNGWLQNLLLGTAVASFFVYVRLGMPGRLAPIARAFVKFLSFEPLRKVGAYSYSIYLTHFPILHLLIAITTRFTQSVWIVAALGFFIYLPLTVWIAFRFHVAVERRFQKEPAKSVPATRTDSEVALQAV